MSLKYNYQSSRRKNEHSGINVADTITKMKKKWKKKKKKWKKKKIDVNEFKVQLSKFQCKFLYKELW